MEYARFGAGWVRRASAAADWEFCPLGDVPAEEIGAAAVLIERRRLVACGVHPDGGVEFAKVIRRTQG